ncbi:two-component system competent response regulator ComA [Natronobacillus azotifigens]|uniref:Response regulator transcription factor n=1 Tax=Natronobacillus azotifigens TaxID=472978 RepID=A0A9J6RE31_9BACI|nr:response regulator transcription factor [Natronobacillus azotifigens]MCZ0703725.1 response regulator transcription factor [Natronobacillus azotifigens]
MIKIAIVDDHSIVGEGTKTILSKVPDFLTVYQGSSIDFCNKITEKQFDVYLIDLHMPDIDGLQLTKKILQHYPDAKVIILTAHDISSHFNQFIDSGVTGFISKESSSDDLITTIRCALKDQVIVPLELLTQLKRQTHIPNKEEQEIRLTEKEEKILLAVANGATNTTIAEELFTSQRSIERHLSKLFKKANVSSRSELITKAKELNIVPEFMG